MFFSLGLHVESSPIYRHFPQYALCEGSSIGIPNACNSALQGSISWFRKCWCGTIATTFSQVPGRDSQGHRLFPSCSHLLNCDDKCILSPVLSTSGLHYSRWQSGEICQVLSTGAFTLFCHVVHGFKEDFMSFFVPFVLVSCSRVCLLDVSRLLGLTLIFSLLSVVATRIP